MSSTGNADAHALFISDLHLCESRPDITAQFIQFLQHTAIHAEALYILGDLFEYWAGDDDLTDPHHHSIIQALAGLSQQGIACYLIHGNRDFLMGAAFAHAARLEILQDPSMRNLYGHQVLLSHGDALCTDDVAYQAFRRQVRQPEWQQQFLNQPLEPEKHRSKRYACVAKKKRTSRRKASWTSTRVPSPIFSERMAILEFSFTAIRTGLHCTNSTLTGMPSNAGYWETGTNKAAASN